MMQKSEVEMVRACTSLFPSIVQCTLRCAELNIIRPTQWTRDSATASSVHTSIDSRHKNTLYIFLFHTRNVFLSVSKQCVDCQQEINFLLFFPLPAIYFTVAYVFSLSFLLLVCHCFVLPFFILCSFFGLHSANDFHAIRFDSKAKVRMSLRFLCVFFYIHSFAHSQHCTRMGHNIIYDYTKRSHFNRVLAVQTTVNTLHKLTRMLFCRFFFALSSQCSVCFVLCIV